MLYYILTTSMVIGYYYKGSLTSLYNKYVNRPTPIIVSIDGNIGSGKSTFIKILQKTLDERYVSFAAEPVDIWTGVVDKDGNNILQCFYDDKDRWSYTFQNFAYITRLMELDTIMKNSLSRKVIITERSVLTDRNVFAKMLHEAGFMSELEMKIYRHWYDYFDIKIDHTIYIKTDVENCVNRIKKRGREAENSISVDYLSSLEREHDEWLLNDKNCIILNGNVDFVTNKVDQDHLIQEFKKKLMIASNIEV